MTESCYRGSDGVGAAAGDARGVGRRGRAGRAAGEALVRSVYLEHGGAVLAYTTRLLGGDRAAAEDVVQEVLLRAWRNPDFTVAAGSTRGWLLTVARNLVIDRHRARGRRPAEVIGEAYRPPVGRDIGDQVVDAMLITGVIGRLSPEHRQVLVELYYNDRSVAETAEHLGLAPGTVKSRAYYALRALRGMLAEPEGQGARTGVPGAVGGAISGSAAGGRGKPAGRPVAVAGPGGPAAVRSRIAARCSPAGPRLASATARSLSRRPGQPAP
jgi:RNA polymerase sigma-70 factor, ECF subfamily